VTFVAGNDARIPKHTAKTMPVLILTSTCNKALGIRLAIVKWPASSGSVQSNCIIDTPFEIYAEKRIEILSMLFKGNIPKVYIACFGVNLVIL
jgi:hypothetical protein